MIVLKGTETPVKKTATDTRRYWLPRETPLEIIETRIDPNTSQEWHGHSKISEAILMIEGMLAIETRERKVILGPGELCVITAGEIYGLRSLDEAVVTLTIKFTGNGKNAEDYKEKIHP